VDVNVSQNPFAGVFVVDVVFVVGRDVVGAAP
jgi:hypothetical protein